MPDCTADGEPVDTLLVRRLLENVADNVEVIVDDSVPEATVRDSLTVAETEFVRVQHDAVAVVLCSRVRDIVVVFVRGRRREMEGLSVALKAFDEVCVAEEVLERESFVAVGVAVDVLESKLDVGDSVECERLDVSVDVPEKDRDDVCVVVEVEVPAELDEDVLLEDSERVPSEFVDDTVREGV